jgi:hypothetical protein
MQCILVEFFLVYLPCMIQQRINLVPAEVPNGNDMSRFLSLPVRSYDY